MIKWLHYRQRCLSHALVQTFASCKWLLRDTCGSGRTFVQTEKYVEAHCGIRTDVSVFGQKSNPTTWRLAHINLAIHGIEPNVGPAPADTFLCPQRPDLKTDFVLANLPFNVSDFSGPLLRGDTRFSFGGPPVGNAYYAWIQHFFHRLSPRGVERFRCSEPESRFHRVQSRTN